MGCAEDDIIEANNDRRNEIVQRNHHNPPPEIPNAPANHRISEGVMQQAIAQIRNEETKTVGTLN